MIDPIFFNGCLDAIGRETRAKKNMWQAGKGERGKVQKGQRERRKQGKRRRGGGGAPDDPLGIRSDQNAHALEVGAVFFSAVTTGVPG